MLKKVLGRERKGRQLAEHGVVYVSQLLALLLPAPGWWWWWRVTAASRLNLPTYWYHYQVFRAVPNGVGLLFSNEAAMRLRWHLKFEQRSKK